MIASCFVRQGQERLEPNSLKKGSEGWLKMVPARGDRRPFTEEPTWQSQVQVPLSATAKREAFMALNMGHLEPQTTVNMADTFTG